MITPRLVSGWCGWACENADAGDDHGSENAAEGRRHGPDRGRAERVRGALRARRCQGSVERNLRPGPVAAGARTRGLGSGHPHHRGAASPPAVGIPAGGRPARRNHGDPQLRPRRVGHVALVGHGPDGRRDGPRPRQPPGGRDRLRGRGPHRGAPASAARVRRHHLRPGGAPEHHLEHVDGGVHADVGTRRPRPPLPRVGRAVP